MTSIITVEEVLEILISPETEVDTQYSAKLFKIEEGREDEVLKKSHTCGRREWLIISELYASSDNLKHSQKFHVTNYLKFRIENGLSPEVDFKTRRDGHLP